MNKNPEEEKSALDMKKSKCDHKIKLSLESKKEKKKKQYIKRMLLLQKML